MFCAGAGSGVHVDLTPHACRPVSGVGPLGRLPPGLVPQRPPHPAPSYRAVDLLSARLQETAAAAAAAVGAPGLQKDDVARRVAMVTAGDSGDSSSASSSPAAPAGLALTTRLATSSPSPAVTMATGTTGTTSTHVSGIFSRALGSPASLKGQ